jgi:hypothetical protein
VLRCFRRLKKCEKLLKKKKRSSKIFPLNHSPPHFSSSTLSTAYVPFTISPKQGHNKLVNVSHPTVGMRQHQGTVKKLGSAMANVLSASRFIASFTATYFAFFFFGGAPKAS